MYDSLTELIEKYTLVKMQRLNSKESCHTETALLTKLRPLPMQGVGIILNESEALSGKTPIYELFDEELRLTIFAAKQAQESEKQ